MSQPLANYDFIKPFQVLISNLPPEEIGDLPEDQQWRPLKDQMRRIKPEEALRVAQQESSRTGTYVTRGRIREIETLLEIYEPPRNDVCKGVATLGFNSFDEAVRTYEFVQGHIWKGYVLEAWLMRKNKGDLEDFLGPRDHITGRLRPAPIPRSLNRFPLTPSRGSHRTPLKSHSTTSSYASSDDSTNSMFSGGVPRSIYSTSSFQQHQGAPRLPSTPSSSRNGSISSSSTTLARDAYAAVSTFHTTSNTLGFPLSSAYTNVPNRPAVGYASHINAQRSTPLSSISANASQALETTSAPTRYYRVTVRNLSLEATKERVGELIEQKTRIYVPLAQPQPIKLQQHKGQIHAYVKFTRKDDAEKAVRGIRGLRFLGRPLQAILEVVVGQ